MVDASAFAAGQQTGLLQHAQVPRYGGQRDRVRLRQLSGGRFAAGETLQDASPNGIG